jgi:hypothetical protein
MLRINKYYRQAIAIRTINDNGYRLRVSISHDNGRYRAYFAQERVNGYCVEFEPLAECNGWTSVKDGRFNRKLLEKFDTILTDNIEKYYNLWANKQYQELALAIRTDCNA